MRTPLTALVRTAKKRVFLIESHCTSRDGIKRFINAQRDFLVCGEAETLQKSLAHLKTLRPDIILVGLVAPDGNVLQIIEDVHSQFPDIGILLFCSGEEGTYAERCLRCGARGYLMKTENNETLLKALQQVASNNIYISPRLCTQFLGNNPRRHAECNDWGLSSLTNREYEVFDCIGQGLTTKEVGHQLHISPKTVETHRAHIRVKLGLMSRAELIKYAIRWVATQEQCTPQRSIAFDPQRFADDNTGRSPIPSS